MDLDDVRTIIATSRADVWALIDTAVTVASLDHDSELKYRRDAIVERLYSNPLQQQLKRAEGVTAAAAAALAVTEGEQSSGDDEDAKGGESPLSPQSVHRNEDDDEKFIVEEELDPCGGIFYEEAKILRLNHQFETQIAGFVCSVMVEGVSIWDGDRAVGVEESDGVRLNHEDWERDALER